MVPLLVCLIGIVAYALIEKGKGVEIARLMFACGLLVTLFQMATRVIRF